MSKAIVFDTGPMISMSLNNLLWLMPKLREAYGGKFYITQGVKHEAIDTPLKSKKFKFEAFQVLRLLEDGVIEVFDHPKLKENTEELLELSNSLFSGHGHNIKNVHYAEVEVISAAILCGADAIVIDEFVTRMLIEDPRKVRKRMKRKMHMPIRKNNENLKRFKKEVKEVNTIRSMELVTMGYELGFLDAFAGVDIPNVKRELLDAVLWGLKLNGCSSMNEEISDILKFEGF